jgi:Ca2+-dependent lipid-binding protein
LIYLKKGNPDQWISQGRTETLKDCLNPNFKTSFKVDYIFQIKQELKVEVRDDDGSSSEIIGSVPFQLGAVVGAKSNTLILDLMNKHNKP